MPRYVFLITTDGANIVNPPWRQSVLAFAEGRDEETAAGETWFNSYVLLGTEDPCRALVAINTNVPPAVRSLLAQDSAFWQLIEFGGEIKTVPEMLTRLIQWAGQLGFTHYWHIEAGQQLPALTLPDLLAMFQPVPGSV
jgi:hypothetical protein